MKTINWSATKEDTILISKIAKRAKEMNSRVDFLSVQMDIAATHLNGNELKLEELLEADVFNFNHDVYGINRHIDRETGKLLDCFLPRFTK